MKEQILKLRSEGKTYNEIQKELGCSKSTISYYCGDGQKMKSKLRQQKKRSNILSTKITAFKSRKLYFATRDFQKGSTQNKFKQSSIINKFGEDTFCYLSGKPINLLKDKDYELDHIIPISKGGDNSFSNLGILSKDINRMKHKLDNETFINYCKMILEYQGYIITEVEKKGIEPF